MAADAAVVPKAGAAVPADAAVLTESQLVVAAVFCTNTVTAPSKPPHLLVAGSIGSSFLNNDHSLTFLCIVLCPFRPTPKTPPA